MKKYIGIAITIVLAMQMTSCSNPSVFGTAMTVTPSNAITSSEQSITSSPTPFQPEINTVYWSPSVPMEWTQTITGVDKVDSLEQSALSISIAPISPHRTTLATLNRVFAVGVAFPTVTDAITLGDVQRIWFGDVLINPQFSRILVTEPTKLAMTELWGPTTSENVLTVAEDIIVEEVWNSGNSLAIIPFENIEPQLKILRVDGVSPLDRPMDSSNYPLSINYTLSVNPSASQVLQPLITQLIQTIPATNRDETKMTVLIMTGTTALARVIMWKIDNKGYEHPIELIKDWFLNADLKHVSNEASFNEDCVYTDAYTMSLCAKPDQIKVLENLGINVVESTGNHLNDFGSDKFVDTLAMYQERGWLNFGGGINQESAQAPATVLDHGNKIAFIGCNTVGFGQAWATATEAGAARCDFDYYFDQIESLKSQGYVVIATYQFQEIDERMYSGRYRDRFQEASMAGADIVQGSQAHMAMGFELIGNSLIHYGLGNFLFDQDKEIYVQELIDRHIIYEGRYIGTELLTARLMDASRPVPMDQAEREAFLTEIFQVSAMR